MAQAVRGLSVIIGSRVALSARSLGASFLALYVVAMAYVIVYAGAPADSTWTELKAIPHQGRTALFALAVDPSNNQSVIAGTSDGSLLRSTNGGDTWSVVHSGRAAVTTVSFSPVASGLVLAGTHGGGALISTNGGAAWSNATGLEGRTVRVFAFAISLFVAGTDQGVYLSQDGVSWSRSSLVNHDIDALAVEAIHPPVRLVAGTNSQSSGGPLTLYQSTDGGAQWTSYAPAISGAYAVKLAAGPLPPTGNVRPLIVGTNTGLFGSTDNGASFTPLSGGELLPSTDYTQITFITDHYDRYYVASDGGGASGGLWRTNDAGQTFTSLQPPLASVTALAVSNDENPTLYVATFRPSDHSPVLWAYHDTGGAPVGPSPSPTVAASGARSGGGAKGPIDRLLALPQLPYIGLGLGAVAVILTAIGAHLHGRRK
jgi:photosystem II stability/assembly factor-like uncharacterized protein